MNGHIYRDIVFIGSAGLSGALRLAKENPEKIKERFPEHILKNCGLNISYETCGKFDKSGKMPDTGEKNEDADPCENSITFEKIHKYICGDKDVIIEIGDMGVSAALWELGERIRSGFKVYADRIPVSQMTVEICELFGTDPYKSDSEGCFFVCTKSGNKLCERIDREGSKAVVIGHTTENKGRVMVMEEITRYIDKPRTGSDR